MSLHDLIILSKKCEELEKQFAEAVEVLKLYQYTCPLDGGASVSQYSPAAEFLAKVNGTSVLDK